MKKRILALVVGSTLILQGCQIDKEMLGTMIGSGAGATAGALACKGSKSQGLCILGGAVIGGLIGNHIGKKLVEADKRRLAEETSRAFAANGPDSTRSWRNPDTGVSGRVSVVKDNTTSQMTQITVMKGRLQETPPIDLIGEFYIAKNSTNVRGGPGTNYANLSPGLMKDETVQVVGSVIDNPSWFLIANNGAASGYVYAPLLKPAGMIVSAGAIEATAGNTEQVSVQTNRQCKTVRQDITYADDTTESEDITMCQAGDGTWELV